MKKFKEQTIQLSEKQQQKIKGGGNPWIDASIGIGFEPHGNY